MNKKQIGRVETMNQAQEKKVVRDFFKDIFLLTDEEVDQLIPKLERPGKSSQQKTEKKVFSFSELLTTIKDKEEFVSTTDDSLIIKKAKNGSLEHLNGDPLILTPQVLMSHYKRAEKKEIHVAAPMSEALHAYAKGQKIVLQYGEDSILLDPKVKADPFVRFSSLLNGFFYIVK